MGSNAPIGPLSRTGRCVPAAEEGRGGGRGRSEEGRGGEGRGGEGRGGRRGEERGGEGRENHYGRDKCLVHVLD